jgi:predicted dehydrogenase
MSDKVRVGVVGTGYLGRFHALIYSRMPEVELVGLVDANPDTARQVAAECGCAVFDGHEALLDHVDAVSIVVPTSLHLTVARPFLERGIATLLEKPIAASLVEAEDIVQLAQKHGTLLQIGHLERYNAGVMALSKRIQNPRFIEAHRMGAFVARATDVDVVSDLMIHDIDIILALVQSEITQVLASGTPVLTEQIDIANARLEFANGCVANVIASRVSEKKSRRIRVFGPRHYHSLDFIEQRIELAYPVPRPGQEWPEIHQEGIEIEPVKPLDAELEDFIRAFREQRKPLVDGATGLAALKVAMRVKDTILHNQLLYTQESQP